MKMFRLNKFEIPNLHINMEAQGNSRSGYTDSDKDGEGNLIKLHNYMIDDYCIYLDDKHAAIFDTRQGQGYYAETKILQNLTTSQIVDFLLMTVELMNGLEDIVYGNDADDVPISHFICDYVGCMHGDDTCAHFDCTQETGLVKESTYYDPDYRLGCVWYLPAIAVINYIPLYHNEIMESLWSSYREHIQRSGKLKKVVNS